MGLEAQVGLEKMTVDMLRAIREKKAKGLI
jgi:hypothetical protein